MKLQDREFFRRDVLCVAPELVGRILVRRLPDGTLLRARITETEAYRGEQDTACHASRGRTRRTEVLYHDGGTIYVYLCYGMHWMLNIVTGHADEPQACPELWLEDDGQRFALEPDTRVGIGYAAPEDQARLWRWKCGAQEATP